MKTLYTVCAALFLGTHLSTHAMAAERGGIVIGAGLNGATLSPRHAGENESGVGLELSAGYDFGTRWTILAKTSGARLEDATGASYTLAHLDVLGRYQIVKGVRRFHPYFEGGISRRTARFASAGEDAITTQQHASWGPTFGAGISFDLTPSLALITSLSYTFGEFSSEDCSSTSNSVQTCATSTRLGLGFNWRPARH